MTQKTLNSLQATAHLPVKQVIAYRRFAKTLDLLDKDMPYLGLLVCDTKVLAEKVRTDIETIFAPFLYRNDVRTADDIGLLLHETKQEKLLLDFTGIEDKESQFLAEQLLFYRDQFILNKIHLIVLCNPPLADNLYTKAYDFIAALNTDLHLHDLETHVYNQLNPPSFVSEADKEHEANKNELRAALKDKEDRRRLMLAYYNFADSAERLVLYDKAIEYYEKAKKLARKLKQKSFLVDILLRLGFINNNIGKQRRALTLYQEGLVLSKKLNDDVKKITCFNYLGDFHRFQNKWSWSLKKYEKTLEIVEKNPYKYGEADALSGIGVIFLKKGYFKKGLDYFLKSLKLFQEINSESSEAFVLSHIAILYFDKDRYKKSKEYLEKSLKIDQKLGWKSDEMNSLGDLGEIYEAQGEFREALKFYIKSIKNQKDIRLKVYRFFIIADNLQQQGKLGEAFNYYKQSLELMSEINNPSYKAQLLGKLGTYHFAKKEYKKAQEHFEEALKIGKEIEMPKIEATQLGYLGELYLEQGELEKAKAYFEEALPIFQRIESRRGELEQLNNLGRYHLEKGELEGALGLFRASLTMAREIGFVKGEAIALGNMGIVFQKQGLAQEGKKHLGQACDLLEVMELVPLFEYYSIFLEPYK